MVVAKIWQIDERMGGDSGCSLFLTVSCTRGLLETRDSHDRPIR